MRDAQNGVDVPLHDAGAVRVVVQDQRRLRVVRPLAVQGTDVGDVVLGLGVLEDVDVVSDAPIGRVHRLAGVEEDRVAAGQGAFGEGGGVFHVSDIRPIARTLVEEDAVDVVVSGAAVGRIPVLVLGNVGLQRTQGLGARADVLPGPAVVLVGGVDVAESLDVGVGIKRYHGGSIVRVGTVCGPWSIVYIDHGLFEVLALPSFLKVSGSWTYRPT